ncbi:MAG: 7-carboxy-7-deazaguanine synthase QueE [Bacteroidia bacterium]
MMTKLPVMEHFYTLQGEGAYTGYPAYFIRLAGCDVGCIWCDVKESWAVKEEQWREIAEISELAANSGTKIVVITGGEPAMYDLTLLTQMLHQKGIRTHIETSGSHPLRGDFDWVCLSPKKFLKPREEVYAFANELKIIIYNAHDFTWAKKEAAKCPATTQLFLQAEWSKKTQYYPNIVSFILENPNWRMSVQTHKYLDIP